MLSRGTSYQDLGPDHFDKINRKATANRLASRLRELGYEVHLKLKEPA